MDRFEYLVVRAADDQVVLVSDKRSVSGKPDLHGFLNGLGAEGWELVAVTESESGGGGLGGLLGDTEFVQDLFLKRRAAV